MSTILILSDVYKSKELKAKLAPLAANNDSIEFQLQKEEDGNRILETTVLVAIITAGSTLAGVFIAQAAAFLSKVHEKDVDRELANIVVKCKNGREIQFPAHSSEEEIEKYIGIIKSLEEVEYIAHVED